MFVRQCLHENDDLERLIIKSVAVDERVLQVQAGEILSLVDDSQVKGPASVAVVQDDISENLAPKKGWWKLWKATTLISLDDSDMDELELVDKVRQQS